MSKSAHYQSPYKIRVSKKLPYDRDKGSKNILEMGDEDINEEMSNSYDNLYTKIPQGASNIPQENTILVH
jgi:hypothetical protein